MRNIQFLVLTLAALHVAARPVDNRVWRPRGPRPAAPPERVFVTYAPNYVESGAPQEFSPQIRLWDPALPALLANLTAAPPAARDLAGGLLEVFDRAVPSPWCGTEGAAVIGAATLRRLTLHLVVQDWACVRTMYRYYTYLPDAD